MDKVSGIRKNESEPEVSHAESDSPEDVVNNLSKEMLDEAFETEARTWADMGLRPDRNIAVDLFKLRCEIEILIKILAEHEILNLDDFNEQVQRRALVYMIALRREFGRAQLHAMLTQGIQPPPLPADLKNIIIPPGTKDT